MATNPFVAKPYQTNSQTKQSTPKQSQTAAASSVSKPPANAFMQGLSGAWKGVTNFANSINPFNPANNTANPNAVQPTSKAGLPNAGQTPQIAKTATNVINAAKNAYNSVQIDPNMNVSLNGNKPATPVTNPLKPATPQSVVATPPAQTDGYQATTPPVPTYTPPTSPTNTGGGTGGGTGGTDAQSSVINNLANTTNPDLRQQVINSMANFQNPQYEKAYKTLQDLQNEAATAQAGTENVEGGAPITASDQAGQAGILNRLYAAKIAAAQTGVSNALALGGQQQTGLQSAITATQPQLGQFGQTYYQPPTSAMGGTQGGGNQGGIQLSGAPANDLNTLADAVVNGRMDYQTAMSQLSGYGTAVANQLMGAIQKKNPQFNFNLSASSAGTQQVGQQLSASVPVANQALDALQVAFNNLGGLSGSSVPFIQEFSQNVAMQTGLGRDNVSSFKGALAEARSRINAALTGIIGVDAAGAQANALLPENMTPRELPQKIAAAKQYMQNQLSHYTQSGVQGGGASSGGGSGGVWASLGD